MREKFKRWLDNFLGVPTEPVTPENFEDAVDEFIKIIYSLKKADKDFLIKLESEQLFATHLHHNIGRATRNKWSLWEKDSPLVVFMKEKYGVDHADDIYSIVAMCAWQKIRSRMMTPKLFADACIEHWEMIEKSPNKIGVKIINGVVKIIPEEDLNG